MNFGFSAPVSGPLATPDIITRIATEGEAMGYDYLTVSDHIVIPNDINARYPYSATGEFPAGSRVARHEQLTTLAFIAAKTSRIRLLTSVMVVPHRPAVLTAKILATIDVLSGGRLELGVGAGWMKEEFEAIGAPPFAERGSVTDEYLLAMRELWTKSDPEFHGKHVSFSNIAFEPKPTQPGGPRIWVGGESGPALRRTAKFADGWFPIGSNPAHPMDSVPRLRAGIARLKKLTADAGRDPAAMALGYRVQSYGTDLPAKAGDGERRLFSGAASDMIDDVRALADLGVGWLDFGHPGASADALLGSMRRFHDDIIAKV
jgi:probable F420-dependent oxidoreductase